MGVNIIITVLAGYKHRDKGYCTCRGWQCGMQFQADAGGMQTDNCCHSSLLKIFLLQKYYLTTTAFALLGVELGMGEWVNGRE